MANEAYYPLEGINENELPNLDDLASIWGTQYAQENTPRMSIAEQPQGRGFRFRYKCEGPSHGGLQGEKSEKNHKTYPAVQIHNYTGPVRMEISLVTDAQYDIPHVHELVGRNCDNGIFKMDLQPSESSGMMFEFSNLCIQNSTKKTMITVLKQRIKDSWPQTHNGGVFAPEDEKRIQREAEERAKQLRMNVVTLKFKALLVEIGQTVVTHSNPISDSKNPTCCALKISRLSRCAGSCAGGDEIYILCDKVQRDDISVRFFQEDDSGRVTFDALAEFTPQDVHRQFAIVCQTPPYKDTFIQETVKVQMQLVRPSSNGRETSEPKVYTYYPKHTDQDEIKRKRAKPMPPHYGGGPGGPSRGFGLGGGSSGMGGMGGPMGGGGLSGGSNQSMMSPFQTYGNTYQMSNYQGFNVSQAMHQEIDFGAINFDNYLLEEEHVNTNLSVSPVTQISPVKTELAIGGGVGAGSEVYTGGQGYLPPKPFGHSATGYVDVANLNLAPALGNPEEYRLFPEVTGIKEEQDRLEMDGGGEPDRIEMDGGGNLEMYCGGEPDRIEMDGGGDLEMDCATTPVRPVPLGHNGDGKMMNIKNCPMGKQRLQSEELDSTYGTSQEPPTDYVKQTRLPSGQTDSDYISHRSGSGSIPFSPKTSLPPNTKCNPGSVRQEVNNMASAMFFSLYQYVVSGNTAWLLNTYKQFIHVEDSFGDNMLHLAIINAQQVPFRQLMTVLDNMPNKYEIINRRNRKGQSPLHMAVIMNEPRMAERLLFSGAEYQLQDLDGNTVWHHAISNNYWKCLEVLGKFYNQERSINVTNYEGFTPLHLAAISGNMECLQILASIYKPSAGGHVSPLPPSEACYVSTNQRNDKTGRTPLHLAVQSGDTTTASFLITHMGANINMPDFDGCTPLHLATASGHRDLTAMLVSLGADTLAETCEDVEDISDSELSDSECQGVTPFDMAWENEALTNLLLGESYETVNKAPNFVAHALKSTIQSAPALKAETTSIAHAMDSISLMTEPGDFEKLDDETREKLSARLEGSNAIHWQRLAGQLGLQNMVQVLSVCKHPVKMLLCQYEALEGTVERLLTALRDLELWDCHNILLSSPFAKQTMGHAFSSQSFPVPKNDRSPTHKSV